MLESQLKLQQRDRDLMPEADDLLTDDTLDRLWEWFCMANNEKFQPQLIFAKLINGARKPYRDNRWVPHGYSVVTPGTSAYAPSEFAVTAEPAEVHEPPDSRDETVATETLQTKLATAEDSLQTKQSIINQMEDALQSKQTLINQLEDDLKKKQRVIYQLEKRVKKMDQEQEESRRIIEKERVQLELDCRKRDQEHREHMETMQEERRQIELKFNEMTQEYHRYQRKAEEEKRKIEVDLKDMEQEHRQYKGSVEAEKIQLGMELKYIERAQREYKAEMEREKAQLERDLDTITAKHDSCGPTQVILRSVHFGTFISVANGNVTATSETGEVETFKLLKHPNGTVSFQTNSFPINYLRAGPEVTLSPSCGNMERFWLRGGSGNGSVFIEAVAFPGLLDCESRVRVRRTASAKQLFHLVFTSIPLCLN
ncbi:hypothetical protein BDZ91DRAFT_748798 [Kalaharituber pfeilii]|nr:hypothetical protein BDZ91DRAFT_748748 [Kalaharituber pfeilii]KAF8453721.1 hypothetical protein BDZ91DRAFT_748798 [Kalaharituber pfeilii]